MEYIHTRGAEWDSAPPDRRAKAEAILAKHAALTKAGQWHHTKSSSWDNMAPELRAKVEANLSMGCAKIAAYGDPHKDEWKRALRDVEEENYGRPSHASTRPMREPPMLDYRRFEDGDEGYMHYALFRHPESTAGKEEWYEYTDPEIEEDCVLDYVEWVDHMLLEAREASDGEREEFYGELREELMVDWQECLGELVRVNMKMFCKARKERDGLAETPVLTLDEYAKIVGPRKNRWGLRFDEDRKEWLVFGDGESPLWDKGETPADYRRRVEVKNKRNEALLVRQGSEKKTEGGTKGAGGNGLLSGAIGEALPAFPGIKTFLGYRSKVARDTELD